jgi:hypothetical protein
MKEVFDIPQCPSLSLFLSLSLKYHVEIIGNMLVLYFHFSTS